MTVEQGRNALNHTRRIDTSKKLEKASLSAAYARCLRLTLEIFHYVKEPVVHIGLVNEPNFDLIQIAEGVLMD